MNIKYNNRNLLKAYVYTEFKKYVLCNAHFSKKWNYGLSQKWPYHTMSFKILEKKILNSKCSNKLIYR